MPYKKTEAGSYSRKCRFCGRWIQMRNMGSHFVAWEGEAPHECQHPPANAHPLWVWPDEPKPAKIAKPKPSPSSLPEFRPIKLRTNAATHERAPTEPLSRPTKGVSSTSARPRASNAPSPSTRASRATTPGTPAARPSPATPTRAIGRIETAVAAAAGPAPSTQREVDAHGTAIATPAPTAGNRPRSLWVWLLLAAALGVGVLLFRPATQANSAAPSNGSCPAAYPIKGNDSTGGRIYHVPGGEFYARTNAERCFASASAAEAAGYRRSQR